MNSDQLGKIVLAFSGVLSTYLVAYGIARVSVFHAVETYPEGKGGPRQLLIAKKDQPPGTGWEYQVFQPLIRLEEAIVSRLQNQEGPTY